MATKPTQQKYNRLFTGRVSISTFLTMYTLFLLKKGEKMCGKDICTRIIDRFSGSWSPSHGMLYPILRDMEAEGLLTAEWEDLSKKTRRFYWITEKGREVLRDQLEENQPLFQEALRTLVSMMQDLYKYKLDDEDKSDVI